jgi:hypothetical protein
MTTELNSTRLSALADAVQNAVDVQNAGSDATAVKKRGRKAKVDVNPAVDASGADAPKKVSKKSSKKKDVDAEASQPQPPADGADAPKKKASKKSSKKDVNADAPAKSDAPVADDSKAPAKSDAPAKSEKPKKVRAKKGEDVAVNAAEDAEKSAEKPKRKKRAKKEDSDQPKKKRAMGPYMLFAQSIRAQLKQENPTLKVTELAKLTGQRWGALSVEEKQKFVPANPVDVSQPSTVSQVDASAAPTPSQ